MMNNCRTRAIHPEFSDCLVEYPMCRHAIQFGFHFLCKHPDHKNFIESASQQKGAGHE